MQLSREIKTPWQIIGHKADSLWIYWLFNKFWRCQKTHKCSYVTDIKCSGQQGFIDLLFLQSNPPAGSCTEPFWSGGELWYAEDKKGCGFNGKMAHLNSFQMCVVGFYYLLTFLPAVPSWVPKPSRVSITQERSPTAAPHLLRISVLCGQLSARV